jgi:hypothetical protein
MAYAIYKGIPCRVYGYDSEAAAVRAAETAGEWSVVVRKWRGRWCSFERAE